MMVLIAGLVIFLGIHSVSIFAREFRDNRVRKLGEGPWKGIYSVVALVGFAMIVFGYGQARLEPVLLYTPPFWLKHLSLLLLIPVFPLLVAAYVPSRIRRKTRHPMLLATKLWALSHLLVNGMLADVLLFGSFLAWAVADRIAVKKRGEMPAAVATPWINDVIVVVVGLALYMAFAMWLHLWLIGVAPIATPG